MEKSFIELNCLIRFCDARISNLTMKRVKMMTDAELSAEGKQIMDKAVTNPLKEKVKTSEEYKQLTNEIQLWQNRRHELIGKIETQAYNYFASVESVPVSQ